MNASAEQGACEGWGTGKVPPRRVFKPDGGIPRKRQEGGCEEVTGMGRAHGRSRALSQSWREPGR